MMGTSPPMQNAPTVRTLSASSVAAPASAALPPDSIIFVPASLAAALPDTTIPLLPIALLGPLGLCGAVVAVPSCATAAGAAANSHASATLQICAVLNPYRPSPLPAEPQPELRHPGGTAGIPRAQDAVVPDRRGIVRVIEHVEEIQIEPQRHALGEIPEFECGNILEPLPRAAHILVPPRMQVVIVHHALY